MSPCACISTDMTPIVFANGTVLLRCLSHDTHRWSVGGATVDTAHALRALGELFGEHRDANRRTAPVPAARTAAAAPRNVIALERTAHRAAAAVLGDGADAELTALLHARGLNGSWAVA